MGCFAQKVQLMGYGILSVLRRSGNHKPGFPVARRKNGTDERP